GWTVDDDPPDRPPGELDDVEARLRKFGAVADRLGVELMRHDLLVGGGRKQQGEFRLTRGAEQPVAERAIVLALPPQPHRSGRRGDLDRRGPRSWLVGAVHHVGLRWPIISSPGRSWSAPRSGTGLVVCGTFCWRT